MATALRASYTANSNSVGSVVVQAGDQVVVVYTENNTYSTSIVACTDNASGFSNCYNPLTGRYDATSGISIYAFMTLITVSATLTLTVAGGLGLTGPQIYVAVISGSKGLNAWAVNTAEGSNQTSHTGPTLSLTQTGDYVISHWAEWNATTATWSAGNGLSTLQSSSTGTVGKMFGGVIGSSGNWADSATSSLACRGVNVTIALSPTDSLPYLKKNYMIYPIPTPMNGSTTSATISVAAGDLIIVAHNIGNSADWDYMVTDSDTNKYYRGEPATWLNMGNFELWWATATNTNAALAVKIKTANTTAPSLYIHVVANMMSASGWVLDQYQKSDELVTPTTIQTGPTITPTSNGEYIFSMWTNGLDGGTLYGDTQGFTFRENIHSGAYTAILDMVQTTKAPIYDSLSNSISTIAGNLIASFRPTGATLPTPTRRGTYNYLNANLVSFPVVTGDLILVGFQAQPGSGWTCPAGDVSDTQGLTWTQLGFVLNTNTTSPFGIVLFGAIATATGTETVTVTPTGTTTSYDNISATVWYNLGGATVATVKDGSVGTSNETGAQSTDHTSGSVTTSNANDAIFTYWGQCYVEAPITDLSGWTPDVGFFSNATQHGLTFEGFCYKILTSTGTYSDHTKSYWRGYSLNASSITVAIKGASGYNSQRMLAMF